MKKATNTVKQAKKKGELDEVVQCPRTLSLHLGVNFRWYRPQKSSFILYTASVSPFTLNML